LEEVVGGGRERGGKESKNKGFKDLFSMTGKI
jgi:hypothetical protein